ncbi:MAG: serine/threonine protein kinase [Labilithrix sp.]|nr:serine/threonine protein kinase [Labilithrix sp.]
MTGADTIKDLRDAKRCPECGTGFGREGAFCPFDGAPLEASTFDPRADPLTGTVVAGRYEVLLPLGEGGMGTVYQVRHITLDRIFAMKVLRRDLAKDPALAARFMQEARATAAVRHPSVVAINDFGNLDESGQDAPYFVMEHLVGETLATYLHARGVLEPRVAAAIAQRIADALHAAHAVGVVHRDLKPENVFLVGASPRRDPAADVRIVDFGAAKILGGSALTRPGIVFGTPYYMSPEQASGAPLDGRADVYSLGVLLYEMITGTVPFEAETYMGVLTKHLFEAPTRPSERRGGVQLGALEDLVLRALEKEPVARYPSMQALSAALAPIVEGATAPLARAVVGGTARLPLAPRAGPAPMSRSTADRIESSVARQLDREKRRQWRLAALAMVGAAAALGAIALVRTVVAGDPRDERSSGAATTASPVSPATAASAWIPAPEPANDTAASVSTSVGTAPMPTADERREARGPAGVRRASAGASGVTTSGGAAGEGTRSSSGAERPASTAGAPSVRPSDDFKDPWKH